MKNKLIKTLAAASLVIAFAGGCSNSDSGQAVSAKEIAAIEDVLIRLD